MLWTKKLTSECQERLDRVMRIPHPQKEDLGVIVEYLDIVVPEVAHKVPDSILMVLFRLPRPERRLAFLLSTQSVHPHITYTSWQSSVHLRCHPYPSCIKAH